MHCDPHNGRWVSVEGKDGAASAAIKSEHAKGKIIAIQRKLYAVIGKWHVYGIKASSTQAPMPMRWMISPMRSRKSLKMAGH